MLTAPTAHILLDDRGVAWIDDTNTKVVEVVLDQFAYGWSPEEIHFQHPHLDLAQIHAALSYYYDHRDELDAEIERRAGNVALIRGEGGRQLSRKTLERRLRKKQAGAPNR